MTADALAAATSAVSAAAFATAFGFGGNAVTWLEVVAFLLAILTVWWNLRVDPRAWPVAILSSLLYVALFWRSRLYGDASLQIFFAVISVWGWWRWTRGGAGGGLEPVRALPVRQRLGLVVAFAIAWPATGLFLRRYTDTDVPWWDAFPTALSVIGQWLLGRKYIENWPVWIVVNVASVGLFAVKGLWLTVLLYATFVVMAFAGWRAWRREAGRR